MKIVFNENKACKQYQTQKINNYGKKKCNLI